MAVAFDYPVASADSTSLAQNGHRYGDSPIDTSAATAGAADAPTPNGLNVTPTPEAFTAAVRTVLAMHSGDTAHKVLDRLVTTLLTSLGYGEGMAIFLEAVRDRHALVDEETQP